MSCTDHAHSASRRARAVAQVGFLGDQARTSCSLDIRRRQASRAPRRRARSPCWRGWSGYLVHGWRNDHFGHAQVCISVRHGQSPVGSLPVPSVPGRARRSRLTSAAWAASGSIRQPSRRPSRPPVPLVRPSGLPTMPLRSPCRFRSWIMTMSFSLIIVSPPGHCCSGSMRMHLVVPAQSLGSACRPQGLGVSARKWGLSLWRFWGELTWH